MRYYIKIKLYFLIFVLSIIFAIFFFEIYSSFKKDLFPSYGWQTNNIMSEKVQQCNNKNIGVFGDSFVEYYGKNKINLVEILDFNIKDYNLCNFGLSGTDINQYINRFLFVLENNVKLEKAIFFLYEGNDFSDFRYTKIEKIEYNADQNIDRNISPFKHFVKSTNTFNIIYREIIKKYFFKNKINENLVKKLYSEKNKYFEVPYDKAIERLRSTPEQYKKLFSSDILNINFYKLALRNPNYFIDIFEGDEYKLQRKITFKHLNFINKLCIRNNIDCKIIIIPNDEFLFAEAKEKYTKIFRFNFHKRFGKSRIVKDILNNYVNIFYPEDILEYNDYIKNDMHLTSSGNKKIAKFVTNKIIN